MGLDLVVEGCPKPGHETEWRSILERSFRDEDTPEDQARFQEIVIPAFERVGAPRVGSDEKANDWIINARGVTSEDEIRQTLEEFDGYHVLQLVECDGLPKYTHAGLYEGLDETSFRGSFLQDCQGVLTDDIIAEAWEHRLPEEAQSYGKRLLQALETRRPQEKRGLLSRLGLKKNTGSDVPLAEQEDIVRAAGLWFIYWGEKGHAIRAWF